MAIWKTLVALSVQGAIAFVLGCSGPNVDMPPTFPVTGTVVTEKGQPYSGGSLQFRPDTKVDLTVTGDIKKDGTFTLRTLKGNRRAEGAPAGIYQVTIYPPFGADQKPLFATFTLERKFEIRDEDNHLEIRADPDPR